MPYLSCILDINPDEPGFVIPLFQEPSSNYYLIQNIDSSGNITSFNSLFTENLPVAPVLEKRTAEVGQSALWIYKDPSGELHFEKSFNLPQLAISLLSRFEFEDSPLSGAELVSITKMESAFTKQLIFANKSIEVNSRSAAKIWRNSILFPPIASRDLSSYLSSKGISESIGTIFIDSSDKEIFLFTEKDLSNHDVSLPTLMSVARYFGLVRFELRQLTGEKEKSAEVHDADWILFGVGGISKMVTKRRRYRVSTNRSSQDSETVLCHGNIDGPSEHRNQKLAISIIRSNVSDSGLSSNFFIGISDDYLRHVINVRPIGYGTPSPRKARPQEIQKILPKSTLIWIVAQHRQRQSGTHFNSLSASNTAVRYTSAAVKGLTDCLLSNETTVILDSSERVGGFGLLGAARYIANESIEDNLFRLCYSMICEEAHLHTAKELYVLWPYNDPQIVGIKEIRLGKRRYKFQIFCRPGKYDSDITAFAVGVLLSNGTKREFFDFCISLMAGYGFNYRDGTERFMHVENQGLWLRVWTCTSVQDANVILQNLPEFGFGDEIIVCNFGVSEALKERYMEMSWTILHFSEIGRFMNKEVRSYLFDEY